MQETCIYIILEIGVVIQPAILQSFLSYNMQLYTSCNLYNILHETYLLQHSIYVYCSLFKASINIMHILIYA